MFRTVTAVLHEGDPDEGGYWATCLEVQGANAQGETKAECLEELAEASKLMFEYEKDEALREDAHAEMIPLAVEFPDGV
jgi:predicted RNase H-like HicB family nuclease